MGVDVGIFGVTGLIGRPRDNAYPASSGSTWSDASSSRSRNTTIVPCRVYVGMLYAPEIATAGLFDRMMGVLMLG